MGDEHASDEPTHGAGDEPEATRQEAYLLGNIGFSSGPRLSASILAADAAADAQDRPDSSWKTHSLEEGDEETADAQPGTGWLVALRRRFRRGGKT